MSKRTWISPHGTEWLAETYEEALEMERDALRRALDAAMQYVAPKDRDWIDALAAGKNA